MTIKESTFFPDFLSPQEVIDDINEAFAHKTDVKNLDGTYSGICKRGYAIKMYMNGDKIASAFPVYESDNKESEVCPKMNYNYQIQTVTYGKTGTEYFPIFSGKSLEILASFMGCEAVVFSKDMIHVIKQALDEPNELHGFSGNIYYMEIINGVASFGNDIDEEDKRPLVQVEIHDLPTLMEQWLSDVKFLKTQMKQLPEKLPLITAYLKKEYRYTDKKAADAVKYLMQAREIAVEFVYYIEHGEFIPEKYASNFHGYTAKKLSQSTFLSLLGAFNYMIYLKTKPTQALSHLKKGFPRREIITPEQEAELKKCMD